MKKNYKKPETEVVKIEKIQLLGASLSLNNTETQFQW